MTGSFQLKAPVLNLARVHVAGLTIYLLGLHLVHFSLLSICLLIRVQSYHYFENHNLFSGKVAQKLILLYTYP